MGAAQPPSQPKATRTQNFREVALGFPKKIAQDESRRCPQCAVATCLPGCPLGIDIPGFVRLLREGDAISALARIKKDNPFPAICGRICPAPCEKACIFYSEGAPIGIRTLERYAADFGYNKNEKKITVTPRGKKVAIIGAGPAGLSAAYLLAHDGYEVTIFESAEQPGGLLRYGVPEFRLPQKVLDDQIAEVKALGVVIHTNVFVGRTLMVPEIFMQGFALILLAVGAGVPDFSDIPGEDASGVYYAEEFLTRVQQGRKEDAGAAANRLVKGAKTVVIGGGNAALDAARVALRLGQHVHLVFPGLEEQMEVHPEDLKAAVEEGVVLEAPVDPLAIDVDDDNMTTGVQCRRLEIIESEDGLVLEPLPGSEFSIEAHTVILAHGRKPNAFLKNHLPQLKFNSDGTLAVDELFGQTNVDKIFACGNVTTGAGAVVDAIASGKAAADKIKQFLGQA